MRRLLRLILPALLLSCGIFLSIVGCITWPTSSTATSDWGHQHIDHKVLDQLQPTKITATRVRSLIGNPNSELAGGKILVYSWSKHQETTIHTVAFICSKDNGSESHYVNVEVNHLLLRFDNDGTLCETRLKKGGYADLDAKDLDSAIRFSK